MMTTIESLHKALHTYLNNDQQDSPENTPVIVEKPYSIAPNHDAYWEISEIYLWKDQLRMVVSERPEEKQV